LRLLDGNHRDEVARVLRVTHVALYRLIDPGVALVDSVRRGANLVVGNGATPAEQMRNAANHYWDHEPMGGTIEAAAREFGVKPGTLRGHVRSEELSRKFSIDGSMYIEGADKLNDAERVQLTKFENETILRRACERLLSIPRHTSDHADRIAAAVKKTKPVTEAAQLEAIEAMVAVILAEREEEAQSRGGKAATQRKVCRGARAYETLLKTYFPAGVDPKDVIFDPAARAALVETLTALNAVTLHIIGGLA
jgi:transposase-like protein